MLGIQPLECNYRKYTNKGTRCCLIQVYVRMEYGGNIEVKEVNSTLGRNGEREKIGNNLQRT